jgi:cytochrome c oxidase assembly factor 1
MLPRRLTRPSLLQSLRTSIPQNARRNLIAAPKAGDGPLMSRRSDRALPSISSSHRFLKTFPIFLLVLGASTLAIFNYQKSSSSVVSSSLYALRVNSLAREALGDEIYFRDKIPWIFGTIDQLHGRIDINFGVKGTRRTGVMRFKSERRRGIEFVSSNCCSCY